MLYCARLDTSQNRSTGECLKLMLQFVSVVILQQVVSLPPAKLLPASRHILDSEIYTTRTIPAEIKGGHVMFQIARLGRTGALAGR